MVGTFREPSSGIKRVEKTMDSREQEIHYQYQVAHEAAISCGNDIDFSEMLKILRANAEGRLIVLPCKVGDTVWAVTRKTISSFEVDHINIPRVGTQGFGMVGRAASAGRRHAGR